MGFVLNRKATVPRAASSADGYNCRYYLVLAFMIGGIASVCPRVPSRPPLGRLPNLALPPRGPFFFPSADLPQPDCGLNSVRLPPPPNVRLPLCRYFSSK